VTLAVSPPSTDAAASIRVVYGQTATTQTLTRLNASLRDFDDLLIASALWKTNTHVYAYRGIQATEQLNSRLLVRSIRMESPLDMVLVAQGGPWVGLGAAAYAALRGLIDLFNRAQDARVKRMDTRLYLRAGNVVLDEFNTLGDERGRELVRATRALNDLAFVEEVPD